MWTYWTNFLKYESKNVYANNCVKLTRTLLLYCLSKLDRENKKGMNEENDTHYLWVKFLRLSSLSVALVELLNISV